MNRASDSSRRIKCGRPCADILRLLRSIRQELPLSTSFIHVKAHMDDTLSWEQLSLEQQLNCQCDTLAKAAVSRSLEHDHAHTSIGQLLPRESVGLYVQNRKITSDPAKELRYLLGKMEAKRFLTMEQGWTEDMFEDTGWDGSTKFLPANQSCSDCGLANNTQTSAPLVYKLRDMEYQTTTDAPAVGCPRSAPIISAGAPARAEQTSSWRMCWNSNNGSPQMTTLTQNCATGWLSTSKDGARYASLNWENYWRNFTLRSVRMLSAGET